MLPFILTLALLGTSATAVELPNIRGSTTANINNNNNNNAGPTPTIQFAESRDGWASDPSATAAFSSSKPAVATTYSTGNSFYSSEPGWGGFEQQQLLSPGVQSAGLFTNDVINAGLSIVLGLFVFSLVLQIVTKMADSGIFERVMEGQRSMSSDDMVMYTNMALNAYKKFEKLNFAKN